MTTKKNKNSKSGTLPDGEYNRNTKIEFCCRTDANENKPVVLAPQKGAILPACLQVPKVSNGQVGGVESRVDL